MQFNEIFRSFLQQELRSKAKILGELTLQTLDATIGLPNRVIAAEISDPRKNQLPDYLSAKKCVMGTLNKSENPTLKLRTSLAKNYVNNEISFKLIQSNQLEWGSPELNSYRTKRENLEYTCEEEFWKNNLNVERYKEISGFSCFSDIYVDNTQLSSIDLTSFPFNIAGWARYINDLIELFFKNFSIVVKASSTVRYLKELKRGLFFGFEFNEKKFRNEVKKTRSLFPDYFNIIIATNDHQKIYEEKEYVFKYNDNILSLGVLANPFFFEPCFPMVGYQAVEMYAVPNEPLSFTAKYKAGWIETEPGRYKIIFPETYGEKLKKHAFFYMAMLEFSVRSYLLYLEDVVNSVVKNI